MPQEKLDMFRSCCFCAACGNCDGLCLRENTGTDQRHREQWPVFVREELVYEKNSHQIGKI